ncbi:MAG: rubrerythrin family protein [Halobacteriota archaeon]|nr:rubrerythrin family protein [Halobacteriota archaeon]
MSKTEENLWAAFAGESQARNKYDFFAKVARSEGFEKLAEFFEETARNEHEHAKLIFKLLNGIGDSKKNLQTGIEGETYEYTEMYPGFAKVAREEGEIEAAMYFETVAKVEEEHAKRYKALLENLESGKLLKKDQSIKWKCRKCGYIHEGTEPPERCPLCDHPEGYYEPLCENY